MRLTVRCLIAAVLFSLGWPIGVGAQTVCVGSKNFPEQQILAELVAQLIERHTDLQVTRRLGLGGTGICHAALVSGELDVYVEYTGTALLNVLEHTPMTDPDAVFQLVSQAYRERFDLEWLPPIGFNNTYAIAVRSRAADARGWRRISDLADGASTLRAGFTAEFMERPDGYPGLQRTYGLAFADARDMDPGLMYEALAGGQVDVISAFATNAKLAIYDLRTLEDDKGFFPPYDAAPVVRRDLLERHPEIRAALAPLAGSIDDQAMIRLNAAVESQKKPPAEVARLWIASRRVRGSVPALASDLSQEGQSLGFLSMVLERRVELGRKTLEHLGLTMLAMLIAIALGVPLGVAIHRYRAASSFVLAAAEIVQTIPSLAMLALLFAVYGALGPTPAVTALVLYALLPIVLNTFTSLKELPPQVLEAADGVGMSSRQRLWMVELPLALPVIVAGVRTATVWTVGIATLSTYIGAGGLGDFISRGLARNDAALTLLGALPAALMAVVLSLLIRAAERRLS